MLLSIDLVYEIINISNVLLVFKLIKLITYFSNTRTFIQRLKAGIKNVVTKDIADFDKALKEAFELIKQVG